MPGEKVCAQLFGSVPAVDIWDLLNSKSPLFEDCCCYLPGFRRKGGKKTKPKGNNVTENKKNCRTWTCADKETLPSHVHWRFSPKRCRRRRWRGIRTVLSLTRSTEGDSWQARQLVFLCSHHPTFVPRSTPFQPPCAQRAPLTASRVGADY